jgi:putative ATP-binding cassette transporter
MDATEREFASGGIRIERAEGSALRLDDLSVEAPRGHVLLGDLDASAEPGARIAIAGAPGTGRTMLMRALAGIWPFGRGRIQEPPREQMQFLAQKPYLPFGTLRAAVCYPGAADAFADDRIAEALQSFGVGRLAARLDDEEPWDQQLSAHEQQRVALARVLLHEPSWILLDEATSDLDEAAEKQAYATLAERLPNATLIAVAERPGVLPYLPQRWTLSTSADGRVALVAT